MILELQVNPFNTIECCSNSSPNNRKVRITYFIPEEGGIYYQYPGRSQQFFGTGHISAQPVRASVESFGTNFAAQTPVFRYKTRDATDWTVKDYYYAPFCSPLGGFVAIGDIANPSFVFKPGFDFCNQSINDFKQSIAFYIIDNNNNPRFLQRFSSSPFIFCAAEFVEWKQAINVPCSPQCLFQVKDADDVVWLSQTNASCPSYSYKSCFVDSNNVKQMTIDLSQGIFDPILIKQFWPCVAYRLLEEPDGKRVAEIYKLVPYISGNPIDWLLGGPYVAILLRRIESPYGCDYPIINFQCLGDQNFCPPHTSYECFDSQGCRCCYDCFGTLIERVC